MTAVARRCVAAGAFLVLLAAGFGCVSAGGEELGKPISLKLGERAAFDDDRVAVTFDSVTEDSRCPKDVQCIRAGTARVRLDVVLGTAAPAAVELEVPGDTVMGDWKIEVQRLDPYPISSQSKSKESLIILVVRRR